MKIKRILLLFMLQVFMTCSLSLLVQAESADDSADRIEAAVNDLRSFYYDDNSFSFREALGYIYTSSNPAADRKIIASRFSIKNEENAGTYVENILGLLAAGKNPEDYEGIDYIKKLTQSQNEEGRFIISQSDSHPATQAMCVLALDAAAQYKAQYDEEKVINVLVKSQQSDGSFTAWHDIDTVAMVVTALAFHRDIEGVDNAIEKSIAFIKSVQDESGGFKFMGNLNPYSVSVVIQALIALDMDPLSDDFIKNGNSMLDALLSFKKDKHFEYSTKWGSDTKSASEQAFLALADIYKGESVYKAISAIPNEDDDNDEKYEYEFYRADSGKFRNGQEARLSVSIKRNGSGGSSSTVTFICGVYNKNDKSMVYYTYLVKEVASSDCETITTAFLIPPNGSYEIKAFLWNDMISMEPLAKPIEADVLQ